MWAWISLKFLFTDELFYYHIPSIISDSPILLCGFVELHWVSVRYFEQTWNICHLGDSRLTAEKVPALRWSWFTNTGSNGDALTKTTVAEIIWHRKSVLWSKSYLIMPAVTHFQWQKPEHISSSWVDILITYSFANYLSLNTTEIPPPPSLPDLL